MGLIRSGELARASPATMRAQHHASLFDITFQDARLLTRRMRELLVQLGLRWLRFTAG
jgi:hypothetical protein